MVVTSLKQPCYFYMGILYFCNTSYYVLCEHFMNTLCDKNAIHVMHVLTLSRLNFLMHATVVQKNHCLTLNNEKPI